MRYRTNMVPPIGPVLPCSNPVEVTIEAYRPANGHMPGSLDWSVNSCQVHEREYVERVRVGTNVAPGKYGNAFPIAEPRPSRHCGDVFDYTKVQLIRDGGDDE